jgi:hypothetical protein
VSAESKPYGFIVTDEGRSLIAGWTAGQMASSLALAKIMVGSGIWPDGTELDGLSGQTGLLSPVAQATSTVPVYDGDTVHFTVEYRSDMNGGLTNGFWMTEFGIFVENPSDPANDILFAYSTFSGKPQYVSAYGQGSLDVRRFPVSIIIGPGVALTVMYDTAAFMTAENVAAYCDAVILPQFAAQMRGMIEALDGRMWRLEDMFFADITGNPWMVTFGNINRVDVSGLWNKPLQRIEF